jgi:GAF domain-containing protein
LAQELANRLAISLDNARLFEDSQRAAERERIVNTIAAKLTPQTEIAEILQTAVREVGQALRAPQVNIRLHQANGKNEQR